MRTAFVIYDGMTALDFIGVYDPLSRLKSMDFMSDFNWDICSFTKEVSDLNGLQLIPDSVRRSLSNYELVVVPGGFSTRKLQKDKKFIDWLQSAKSSKRIASVCTGSLLLGAAGFLKDEIATTHPTAYIQLEQYCKSVSKKRICDQGHIITAGGVTSSINLGLYLVEKISNTTTKQKIIEQMDYPYS
jgi:cyclohexyl-isocyanide hydratase